MLALFDAYDHATAQLMRSLRLAGIPCTPVVIRYAGELPEGVRCPFAEVTELPRDGDPLFFNEVPVPPWCEIRQGKEVYGEILRDGARIGRIRYAPNSYRQVERVEWLLADGSPSHADLYDRFGNRYATTHFVGGAAHQTVYRGPGPSSVEVDHRSRAVVLRAPRRLLTFASIAAFVSHFIDEQGLGAERMLINSLSHPLFVAWERATEPNTTLFWQEPMAGDVPGNMVRELERPRALTRIVFGDEGVRRKVADRHPGSAVRLDYLSPLGQFAPHVGYESRRVCILTHSDVIPGLVDLVEALPEVTFTVMAVTLMSEKLHALGRRYANLELIPTASRRRIQEELGRSSVYLDINAGGEVLDVVSAAYASGLVVLAHAPHAKSREHAVVCASVGDVRERLTAIIASPEGREAALRELRLQRGPLSTPGDYRRLLG